MHADTDSQADAHPPPHPSFLRRSPDAYKSPQGGPGPNTILAVAATLLTMLLKHERSPLANGPVDALVALALVAVSVSTTPDKVQELCNMALRWLPNGSVVEAEEPLDEDELPWPLCDGLWGYELHAGDYQGEDGSFGNFFWAGDDEDEDEAAAAAEQANGGGAAAAPASAPKAARKSPAAKAASPARAASPAAAKAASPAAMGSLPAAKPAKGARAKSPAPSAPAATRRRAGSRAGK